MSLLCRLKNLVHKGILKEKDLERIVIIPKDQQPCEYAVNREDLEECKELMTDINGDTVYAVRMSDIRRLSPATSKPNDKALKIISETMMNMINNKPFEEVVRNLENNLREIGIEVFISKDQEPFINKLCVSEESCEHDKNVILDKIKAEISCNIIEDDATGNTPVRLRADWAAANKAHLIDIAIINKYKAENTSNCDSCKNQNEVDGSNCYECVKGIRNNYKADSERSKVKE